MKRKLAGTVFVATALLASSAISQIALAKAGSQVHGKGSAAHGSVSTSSTSNKSSNTNHSVGHNASKGHAQTQTVRPLQVQGVIEKVSGAVRALTAYQHANPGNANKHKQTPHKQKDQNDLLAAAHDLQSAIKQISVVESVYGAGTTVTGSVYTPTTVTGSVYTPTGTIANLQGIATQLQADVKLIGQVSANGTVSVSSIVSDLKSQIQALQALTLTVTLPPSKD